MVKFLKKMFTRFGVPRAIISDEGRHLYYSQIPKILKRYDIIHRTLSTYYPQMSGQVNYQTENWSESLRRMLLITKDREDQLDDALWAYRTTYKIPIGSSSCRLVYGMACHLPVELEYKAYWATKFLNFDSDISWWKKKAQIEWTRWMALDCI